MEGSVQGEACGGVWRRTLREPPKRRHAMAFLI